MAKRDSFLLVIFPLVALSGCAHDPPPAPAPTIEPAPVAPVPAAAEASAAPSATEAEPPPAPAPLPKCADDMPEIDMVAGNVTDTAMTGLAEIVASESRGTDKKTPAPQTGYVNLRYEVRVLQWFSGGGAEKLVLTQGAEAGFRPLAPGRLLFFSACASAGGGYEPDVGYFFPIDPACRAEAEKLGTEAAKRAKPRGKQAPRACQPAKKGT